MITSVLCPLYSSFSHDPIFAVCCTLLPVVCIEPNPGYWRRLSYRKCDVVGAVGGRTANEEILFHFGPVNEEYMGGIVKENFDNKPDTIDKNRASSYYTVTLLQIFELLNAPSVIDYLSLDVEGTSSCVLSVHLDYFGRAAEDILSLPVCLHARLC